MPNDIHTLMVWIRIATFIASGCTTLVPIIYSFSPWYRSRLGQLFMLQGVAFALAMDITCVFIIWQPKKVPDLRIALWLDAFLLTNIAVSTLMLAMLILRMNVLTPKGRHHK